MRTRRVAGLAAAMTAVALAALIFAITREGKPPPVEAAAAPAPKPQGESRLYCEFYNFAGRTPKVGFYFAKPAGEGAAYGQLFQREADGSQTLFDERPIWTYDRSGEAPTLRSPDGAIQINLYGDGGANGRQPDAGGWFEAGLRSIQYLNLDGQCRRTES
ncbi:hypothetical protein [Methylorubrum thiocyanatum]|uniref:Uncharacterized protein n=1 Tax=Methylorubrum thiocyanatum TaxID=47958 RepID=A0AA40VA65_9HYPH|nr:hypothetical protein [Methylorubrum thiocyanatum]MBA8911745.1 hypothetical protein [Methylorubrum thiocyanatum]GJE79961.1 hypothetical protein CJNNKLLH_1292 [Methylorubrum thiocyanatum]